MPSITYSTIPLMTRAELATDQNAVYAIPLTAFRTWDALATNLPAAAAADDLGLVTGTLGTHGPNITAGDVKATSSTRYARCQVPLPVEYKAGGAVTVRAKAGMQTTVADTSCTIDFQVYRVARDTTVGADICATSATTINSLTFAEKEFTITPTTLGPGDLLDIRMAIIYVDGATGTAVTPTAAAVELLCDIRG